MKAAPDELRLGRVIARLNVGGPAIHVILLTAALRHKGYQSLLVVGDVPEGEASMEYFAVERGVAFTRIAGMSRGLSLWHDLRAFVRLIRLFRAERLTIVHTHTAKAGALGRLAATVCGVPVRVHTFHGHVFSGYFSGWRSRLAVAIERVLARFTDRIVAISDSQRRDLVQTYRIADGRKVRVVPLGLDLDPLLALTGPRGAFRQSIDCPDRSLLVCWIGRLTAVKAPERFLELADRIARSEHDVRFAMVGDGEQLPLVAERIRQLGLSRVALTGVSRSMAEVYADVDLVVLTSHNEGTPVALIECMAAGKPFVATAVGGVPDLMAGSSESRQGFQVFENCILTETSADAIHAGVEYLLTKPETRRTMGAAGRRFAAGRFSADRLADDLDRLYREVLAEKGLGSDAGHTAGPRSPA